ncbi:MAG TPA: hypothetical protein VGC69_05215, partial [Bordetella sp.]
MKLIIRVVPPAPRKTLRSFMSALYDSSDFSVSQTPMALRVGAGVLVLALHVAFIAAFVLGKKVDKLELPEEPAVMVSVIDAPAPQQAKAELQPETVQPPPQPPAPVDPPPVPPVEQPPVDPPPVEPDPEPDPPPVVHPEPLAPVIKPHPKPPVKPPVKQQPVKAQPVPPAPTPPAPAAVQAPSGTPDGQQQVSQAPRQADPVMVNSVEYDCARPMPVYPTA